MKRQCLILYLPLWFYMPASVHKILTCESTIISEAPSPAVIRFLQKSRCCIKTTNKEIFVDPRERVTREDLLRMVCCD
jgi:hypothetical protein